MNKKPILLALILLFGLATGFAGWAFANKDMALYWMQMAELRNELEECRRQQYIQEAPIGVIIEKRVPDPYFVIQKVPVYVDRVKEVEVEKEVIRWRNIYPREFESLEHFKGWYKEQEFHPILPSPAYEVDCDDYAERVQWVALQQGYSVSCHLGPTVYWRPPESYKGHLFNMVIIGNDIYYLEPEPGRFKVWKVGEKD